jgi:hypothetical protein
VPKVEAMPAADSVSVVTSAGNTSILGAGSPLVSIMNPYDDLSSQVPVHRHVGAATLNTEVSTVPTPVSCTVSALRQHQTELDASAATLPLTDLADDLSDVISPISAEEDQS